MVAWNFGNRSGRGFFQRAEKMYSIIENDYAIYSMDMFEDDGTEIEAYDRLFGSNN